MSNLLKETAYEKIIEMIDNGHFEYGKLYSLNAIAVELKMSRTPVRDALQQLESELVIDILQSRGFRLHQIDEEEVKQIYHYTCAVEGYCVAMLAVSVRDGKPSEYIEQMKKLMDEMNMLYKQGAPLREFFLCDTQFHRVINESLEDAFFNGMNKKRRGFLNRSEFHFAKTYLQPKEIISCHNRIMDAVLAGNPVEAYKALIHHADLMVSQISIDEI